AQALAERLFQRADLDDAGRIQWAYRVAFGRTPSPREVARAAGYLADYQNSVREILAAAPAAKPGAALGGSAVGEAAKKPEPAKVPANPDDPVPAEEQAEEQSAPPGDPRVAAWASFCQALLSAAEFRYVR